MISLGLGSRPVVPRVTDCICELQTNETSGRYCYDVIYSPYSSDAHLLMLAAMTEMTSRVCCVVTKTGHAVADFIVSYQPPAPHIHSTSHNLTFSMHCFHNETFTGTMHSLSFFLCLSVCLFVSLCVFAVWGTFV